MATNRAKARAMATKKAKAGTIATEQDITDQRDSDIEVLDDKIREAIAMKNGLAIGDPRRLELSDAINQRMESRTDLAIRELKAGLDSAQLAAAMAKIRRPVRISRPKRQKCRASRHSSITRTP
jgi:hypothetical protein